MRRGLLGAVALSLCARLSSYAALIGSGPIGDPVLEPATLHCLSVHWVIGGDENQNAAIGVAWRTAGAVWQKAAPLLRVERGAHRSAKGESSVEVPEDASLFAGSLLGLAPATEYELSLTLTDPDGGDRQTLIKARTITEPAFPGTGSTFHVSPGSGGGNGTAAEPFRGLSAAHSHAKPGAVFLLHGGTYAGAFIVRKSGEPGNPIVWRAAGDGEVIIDGRGPSEQLPGRAISADHVHDVWFEDLTIRNADKALVLHGAANIVVRRCRIHAVNFGIIGTTNERDTMRGCFIADNVIEGPSTWPRTKGIESARGIQLTGEGHIICHNRVRGFADAINTFPSRRCATIDIHHNDISECTDDGIELDYSERNVRCFANRLTNVFQGISVQPVHGGPIYVFRNALYNVGLEVFKMHNSPSGVLFVHNTAVKRGLPAIVFSGEPVRHCFSRNNLFIGTAAPFAFESTAPMQACDFDHDGFGGGPFEMFLKWNGKRYRTIDEVRATAPVYRNAVLVEPERAFASGALPPEDEKQPHAPVDLRLGPGSAALDSGQPLTGFNDNFAGSAPDLGAHELGAPLTHYGPRTSVR